MPYGIIKVDQVTFTNAGVDQTISVSGIVASISGNITATGTISGNVIRGGTTVSGATVTGNAGQFNTITGNIASFTSGVFAAGSATTPSISFTGDDNTGIYSPGADQVAITTSGTGRLFIDSSGRLLVGTSTARSNFFGTTLSSLTQTEGTGGSTARGSLSVINNDVSNNPPYVLLGRSGAATLGSNAAVVNGSRLGTLTFHGADGTSFIEAATVGGEVDGTPGTNDMPGRLVFSTTADGAASPTERLRITSAGLVGIGTSSPGAKLDVSGSGNLVRLGDGTNTFDVRFQGPNNWSTQLDTSADKFNIQRNSVSFVTIDSSGRLGIGTTSPATALHTVGTVRISRSDDAAQYLNLYSSAGEGFIDAVNSNSGINQPIIFRIGNNSATTERARIDSSGRLLVGTSSSLDVNAGLQIAVNSSFSDFYPLQVFHFDSTDDTQGPTTIYTRSKSDTIGTVSAVNVNDGLGTILFRGAGTSAYVNGALIKAEVESGTVSNTSMPTRLVFSTTADGASSPTERMRITNGGEILFGATSTTNGCKLALANTNSTRKWGFGTIGTNTYFAVVDDTTGSGVQLNAGSTSWSTFSDERLKENLVPIQNGLNKVAQLRAMTGRYKTDDPDVNRSFLIAQDVQAVLPEAVDVMSDDIGTLSLKYTEVIPLLVSALKESKERIETLEAAVTALQQS